MTHTPWHANIWSEEGYLDGAKMTAGVYVDGHVVAYCGKEHAHLIAAAPDLLAALASLDNAFCNRHGCFPLDRTNENERLWNDAMNATRKAIAKAKREAKC